VYSGAFDCFGYNRSQFFCKPDNTPYNGIERLIKYNNDYQNSLNSSQVSLFGGTTDAHISEPVMPECPEWGLIERLKFEKDMIGIYLTGHPLDNYKFEMEHFCTYCVRHLALINRAKSGELNEIDTEDFNKIKNRELVIGGLVSNAQHRTTKTGKPFGSLMLEDYSDSFEVVLFGEDYVRLKQFFTDGYFIQIRGTVGERFKQKDNWELKITSMNLLSDLRDKMSKCITIQFPLHQLSETFITEIDDLVRINTEQNSQRNCQLKFTVFDSEETIAIEMPSKSVKIFPSNEFIEQLHKLQNITYKLN
jgi:DNA polymerase-3 subunit alpha